MTAFAIAAAILVALVIVFLLPPLLKRRPLLQDERRQANLAIFRDQESELEREKSEGSLSEADYQQARDELQRRLLEDVDGSGEAAGRALTSTPTAVVLSLLLPVGALGGYLLLGEPAALVQPSQQQAAPDVTAQQINNMVAGLAARLKENPNDEKGWVMLARSYKAMGRWQESADAYAKGGSQVQQNPSVLADYAEVLATLSGGHFDDASRKLLQQALKLNPEEPQALLLAGADARERGDVKAAIAYWERLMPMIPPGSEDENVLRDALAGLRQQASEK